MNKAIVTGGAGFIGSHIVEKLIETGVKVVIVDDFSSGKPENIPKGVHQVYNLDVCNFFRIAHELKDTDVIFHNAASKKRICEKDPSRDLDVNGKAVLDLLLLCRDKDIRFVHASTGSVYGRAIGPITEDTPLRPVSYYGVSKLSGEQYVQVFHYLYGMKTVVLRYFHVYGPRQNEDPDEGGVVAIFMRQVNNNLPIVIHGDGEQERSFTYVDDVVKANILAATDSRMIGNVYNIASGIQVTVNQLADTLMQKIGNKVGKYYAEPLPGDAKFFSIDNLATSKLGIGYILFDEGTDKLLAYEGINNHSIPQRRDEDNRDVKLD